MPHGTHVHERNSTNWEKLNVVTIIVVNSEKPLVAQKIDKRNTNCLAGHPPVAGRHQQNYYAAIAALLLLLLFLL